VRKLSYIRTDVFFLTFNLYDMNSFTQLEEFWIPDVHTTPTQLTLQKKTC